jgi:azurin
MTDSIATPAKTESAQPDFSHGLLYLCTFPGHSASMWGVLIVTGTE